MIALLKGPPTAVSTSSNCPAFDLLSPCEGHANGGNPPPPPSDIKWDHHRSFISVPMGGKKTLLPGNIWIFFSNLLPTLLLVATMAALHHRKNDVNTNQQLLYSADKIHRKMHNKNSGIQRDFSETRKFRHIWSSLD